MFDQTQGLSLPNLLYRYIIYGCDNSFSKQFTQAWY